MQSETVPVLWVPPAVGAGEGVDMADPVTPFLPNSLRELACTVLHKEHDWVLELGQLNYERGSDFYKVPLAYCSRCKKNPEDGNVYLRILVGGQDYVAPHRK